MQLIYDSEHYAVMAIDLPVEDDSLQARGLTQGLTRGGYEIVDKRSRQDIWIDGALAQSFREGAEALARSSPQDEQVDDFIERYTALRRHPLVQH